MAKIEDLISKKSKKEKPSVNTMTMEGSFSCQTCSVVSDEAEFDKSAGTIIWTCENNHISKVNLS
jgi:hypothetical protein